MSDEKTALVQAILESNQSPIMSEAEHKSVEKIALMDVIMKALESDATVTRLVGVKSPAISVELTGNWMGIWPLPGQSGQLQHNFAVTSSHVDERTLQGLLVGVQNALIKSNGVYVESFILLDTGKIQQENGIISRNDLFAALVRIKA
jgi:hypothetical protein